MRCVRAHQVSRVLTRARGCRLGAAIWRIPAERPADVPVHRFPPSRSIYLSTLNRTHGPRSSYAPVARLPRLGMHCLLDEGKRRSDIMRLLAAEGVPAEVSLRFLRKTRGKNPHAKPQKSSQALRMLGCPG